MTDFSFIEKISLQMNEANLFLVEPELDSCRLIAIWMPQGRALPSHFAARFDGSKRTSFEKFANSDIHWTFAGRPLPVGASVDSAAEEA